MDDVEGRRPIVLVQHFDKEGERWHRKYVRYKHDDNTVKDYLIHKSEKKCDCDGGGG